MLLNPKKTVMVLLAFGLILLIGSCANQEPIKIGFVAPLSGKYAKTGAPMYDAAQMFIADVNANGGINGRQLKLLAEDDKNAADVSQVVDAKLVEEGVVAIIGHPSSTQTAAVLEQMNEAEVVLLSPLASSAQFSHQKDYFFRIIPASDTVAAVLARYAYDTMSLREVSGIYDLDNEAYTRSFWEAFIVQFEALGGEIGQTFPYKSSEADFAMLAEGVLATEPSALVFVTSSIDMAILAQYINSAGGENVALLSPELAQPSTILTKGGTAVEGMVFVTTYNENNPNSDFQVFLERFQKEYGIKPAYPNVSAYEAVQLLVEALKQTGGEAEGLPEALANIKDFPVLQGNITMNEYGDVERDVYITVVDDGTFKIIDTVSGN